MWNIVLSKEMDSWLDSLDRHSISAILKIVYILREIGPQLGRPYVDSVKNSCYKNLKELRVHYKRNVFRIFFIFDQKRNAIFLIGGGKRGNKRFYQQMIPLAEAIYKDYLKGVK